MGEQGFGLLDLATKHAADDHVTVEMILRSNSNIRHCLKSAHEVGGRSPFHLFPAGFS